MSRAPVSDPPPGTTTSLRDGWPYKPKQAHEEEESPEVIICDHQNETPISYDLSTRNHLRIHWVVTLRRKATAEGSPKVRNIKWTKLDWNEETVAEIYDISVEDIDRVTTIKCEDNNSRKYRIELRSDNPKHLEVQKEIHSNLPDKEPWTARAHIAASTPQLAFHQLTNLDPKASKEEKERATQEQIGIWTKKRGLGEYDTYPGQHWTRNKYREELVSGCFVILKKASDFKSRKCQLVTKETVVGEIEIFGLKLSMELRRPTKHGERQELSTPAKPDQEGWLNSTKSPSRRWETTKASQSPTKLASASAQPSNAKAKTKTYQEAEPISMASSSNAQGGLTDPNPPPTQQAAPPQAPKTSYERPQPKIPQPQAATAAISTATLLPKGEQAQKATHLDANKNASSTSTTTPKKLLTQHERSEQIEDIMKAMEEDAMTPTTPEKSPELTEQINEPDGPSDSPSTPQSTCTSAESPSKTSESNSTLTAPSTPASESATMPGLSPISEAHIDCNASPGNFSFSLASSPGYTTDGTSDSESEDRFITPENSPRRTVESTPEYSHTSETLSESEEEQVSQSTEEETPMEAKKATNTCQDECSTPVRQTAPIARKDKEQYDQEIDDLLEEIYAMDTPDTSEYERKIAESRQILALMDHPTSKVVNTPMPKRPKSKSHNAIVVYTSDDEKETKSKGPEKALDNRPHRAGTTRRTINV